VTADLIFYLLAILTILPAFWVVLSPNIVHAGFALLFTLLGAAGLYAWMGADFIAVTQLMVYIGGVLVLILFTVMMTRVPQHGRTVHGLDRYVPPAVISLAVMALLWKVITGTEWATKGLGEVQPTTAVIGTNFMTNYIFPFEFVSLVLLAAMIGAAILIRERKVSDLEEPTEEQDQEEVQS
jgi:NADH:ubiquinone oxidoreductase subunit 6 (subunit J)